MTATQTRTRRWRGSKITDEETIEKSPRLTAMEQRAAAHARAYESTRSAEVQRRLSEAATGTRTGDTLQVSTAPGPEGQVRRKLIVGGHHFGPEPTELALVDLTRAQYDAIMAHRLLNVEGGARPDFTGFAGGAR